MLSYCSDELSDWNANIELLVSQSRFIFCSDSGLAGFRISRLQVSVNCDLHLQVLTLWTITPLIIAYDCGCRH